jgi:phage terminase large subunit-like protein
MARAKRKAAPELSRAERVIAFIESYLLVPDGADVGKPVVLREWQRDIIRQIYDSPTRRFVLSMGRKNGKTAIIAMLVLANLIGPEARRNAQIYSAAQSKDQAAVVFKLAAKMVRMSRDLNNPNTVIVRDSAKELFSPLTGVFYKALSADATTAYGLSPVMVIHDELGQVVGPRSELYDALETAMGAHADPLSVVISTQAPNDGDLLSIILDDALAGEDELTKAKLFAADIDDDPWSLETWKKSNPALGDFRSLKDVQDKANSARRLPTEENAFRNLYLNQRVSAEGGLITPLIWGLNAGPVDKSLFETRPVYVGVDLASTGDLTAIVATTDDEQGNWHLWPWFFLPGVGLLERARRDRVPYDVWVKDGLLTVSPGRALDYDFVAQTIVPVFSKWNVRSFAYDRWQYEHFKQALARQDYHPEFPEDIGQGFKTMTPAIRTFETVALEGRIRHGKHPILTWNFSNARAKVGDAGERKLTKAKSTGRIDGAVATIMALFAANAADPYEQSVYDLIGKREAGQPAPDNGEGPIDYEALQDINHPLFAQMKARFEAWHSRQEDN